MNARRRKLLIFTVKALVAAAMLLYVLFPELFGQPGRKVHWDQFGRTLRQADPWLLAAAFGCFGAPVVVLAVRWWYLLRVQRIELRLWETVRLTLLGTFFNYIVPGVVSGDLVKAWYAAKHTDRKAVVLVSVLVDRVIGLLGFAVVPAAVMIALAASRSAPAGGLAWPAGVIGGVLAGSTLAMALLLSVRLRRLLGLQGLFARLPLQRHLLMVQHAGLQYSRRPAALAWAMALTFLGQGAFVVAIMLTGMSLALPIAWPQYFLYVPLIYIIAAVPVSPGGLGVAEFFYLQFFAAPHLASSGQVLALALVARLMPMIWSLPGVVVAVTGPALPDAAQIQAELASKLPRADAP